MNTLDSYLDRLFAAAPGDNYIELRWRLSTGRMGRKFYPVSDRRGAANAIDARGRRTDVYIGVAPRVRQAGTRDAVERAHALWVDLDGAEGIAELAAFVPQPSIVVDSGHGRHAYWLLRAPVSSGDVERGNRRLADVLRGDRRATDAARILRPPGTLNFKRPRPAPVEIARLEADVFALDEVVGALADAPGERRAVRGMESRVTDDVLLAISPVVYVEALAGREVGRDGKIACPFHEDRTPSLHAYDKPERGWACYGCGRGGTIIDFGARLYGIEPRGSGFFEIRRRLAVDLLRITTA